MWMLVIVVTVTLGTGTREFRGTVRNLPSPQQCMNAMYERHARRDELIDEMLPPELRGHQDIVLTMDCERVTEVDS